jgi:eukaryotic-like serine/threonine-protein kinase
MEVMTLATGSKLGPYEILGQIGAGGMGEVYRAKDPRLSREVAIKVLPASFSADADRLRRFEQEAKAAGVLNHPNITAVDDIGTATDGAPYVVQELLEGETLRSELAGGRFSPRKAIDTATQIAEGLAAAHEKGIVHRDLKPENVFVTRDGRVKILDFGLAKLTQTEGASSSGTNLPTETKGTEPGVVLGTLGYMSPEQVRGKSADARSDIFSFGAILYEMLSGNRAFRGDSAADTMSAILREDPPDLSVTNQNVSPGLEHVVRHCLEKNPERRFQSARDLAFNLGELSGASGTAIAGVAGRRPRTAFPWMAAGGLAALIAAFAAGHFLWKPPSASTPTYRRLTFRRGNIGTARFAPDGHSIVYGASWEGEPLEIYTTRPEGPESTPIGVKNADLLSVSPSGELAISLRERFLGGPMGNGTLATVPIGGGAPRALAEFVDKAAWTPDGKQLAVVRFLDGRYRIELPFGKVVYSTENSIRYLKMSPRGDRFAVVERILGRSWIKTVDLAGKTAKLAGPVGGQGIAWASSGDEIWYDDQGEHGQYFLKAVDLAGRNRVVASIPVGLLIHDVARDGSVLVERYHSQPGIVGLAPGETHERSLSWFDKSYVAGLSDDGRIILINESGDAAGAAGAHYVRKTDGSPAIKLGEGTALALSPDGKWVLARQPDSKTTLVLSPTGPGSSTVLEEPTLDTVSAVAFFPNGKRIVIEGAEAGGKRRLYVQDLPAGKPRPISKASPGIGNSPITPDELWVAVYGDWSEDFSLVPVSGGEPRTIPHTKDLDFLSWAPDGKSFYGLVTGSIPARVVRVEAATGRREPWKALAPAELSGLIDISPIFLTPDGKSYVYSYSRAAASDLYLIEGLK